MMGAQVRALRPWRTTMVLHLVPENDRITHTLNLNCTCEPTVEPFDHTGHGGQKGYEVAHNALDGRLV